MDEAEAYQRSMRARLDEMCRWSVEQAVLARALDGVDERLWWWAAMGTDPPNL